MEGQTDASDQECGLASGDHCIRARLHILACAPIGPVTANALQRRTVRKVYINAKNEHIAASLERREFQMYKIMLPTAIAVLINMSALAAS